FRDYEKLYSRVFPVYDRPKEEGSLVKDMTLRPMRRYFKQDPDKRQPTLSFYPEGGALLAGVPCTVAFEACWSDGEAMDGVLCVGRDSIRTLNRGRGKFVITPTDKPIEATFIGKRGVMVKAHLPQPQREGVALSVCQQDTTYQIRVRVAGRVVPDRLGLSIMCEGNLEVFRPVNDSVNVFFFPTEKFRMGVNQVTVFDADGTVLADRLFFVRDNHDLTKRLSVSMTKNEYAPYEKIDLWLRSQHVTRWGGDMVSVSVRDGNAAESLYDNASIMSEMLLASEIRGFVPDPDWFFERDDEVHRQALDLLMLTQGWRRFEWKEMAVEGAWQQTQKREHDQILTGRIRKYEWVEDEIPRSQKEPVLAPPSALRDKIAAALKEDRELEEWAYEVGRDTLSYIPRAKRYVDTDRKMYVRCVGVRTDSDKSETNAGMVNVAEDGTFQVSYANLQGTGTLFLDVMKSEKDNNLLANKDDHFSIKIDNPY
ncbi:MAG: hypothetical protein HUK03_09340, partial [Bacteroidaceae bacterium]|nr:hypothetical protein [Bacteroidaceae bacterium]